SRVVLLLGFARSPGAAAAHRRIRDAAERTGGPVARRDESPPPRACDRGRTADGPSDRRSAVVLTDGTGGAHHPPRESAPTGHGRAPRSAGPAGSDRGKG